MASPSRLSEPVGSSADASMQSSEHFFVVPLWETSSKFDGDGGDDNSFSCRLCTCEEPDVKGEAALRALGIQSKSSRIVRQRSRKRTRSFRRSRSRSSFSFHDLEGGGTPLVPAVVGDGTRASDGDQVVPSSCLMTLGCSCQGDLALAHYSCALRWFLIRGSSQCEICGKTASNIGEADIRTVAVALLEHHHVPLANSELAVQEPSAASAPGGLVVVPREKLLSVAVQWFDPSERGPRQRLEWIHVLQKRVGEHPLSTLPALEGAPLQTDGSASQRPTSLDRGNCRRFIATLAGFTIFCMVLPAFIFIIQQLGASDSRSGSK